MFISGCEVINPSDPIPSYLIIEPYQLTTSSSEGSNSEKLTEAWLYVNSEFLGAYSLPATVPVLAAGQSEVILFPGVRLNGIASTPDIYPFYTTYEVDTVLIPSEKVVLAPKIKYSENVAFSAVENFDFNHPLLNDLDGDPMTQVVLSTEDVFEGEASGKIVLTAEHPDIQVSTILQYTDLPTNGTPVFLELNYRNNVEFALGVIGIEINPPGISDYFYVFNQQEEWNKIYIELTERLRVSQFQKYQIAFRANFNSSSGESNVIYLDNLKLVHFK
jgi:hypothetical protein